MTGTPAGPRITPRPGERGRTAGSIDDARLTIRRLLVGSRQRVQALLRVMSLLKERQPGWHVAQIRPGLRRDGACTHPNSRNRSTHGKELARDCNPEELSVVASSSNGERHVRTL